MKADIVIDEVGYWKNGQKARSESDPYQSEERTSSAPRGQRCPEYGWWLDPLTDCCGETMVQYTTPAGEYVTWHGYKKDDEPKELRCYRCDKIVWPNADLRNPSPKKS